MKLLIIVCATSLLSACSLGEADQTAELARQAARDAMDSSAVPAAGYSGFRLSEEEIVALETRAASGDETAKAELARYFTLPYSLPHPRGLAWLKVGAEAGNPRIMQAYAIHLPRDEAGCRESVLWAGKSVEAAVAQSYEPSWIDNARSWVQTISEECREKSR